MADIKVYGKLVNKTDGSLADSDQISYSEEASVKAALDNANLSIEALTSDLNEIKPNILKTYESEGFARTALGNGQLKLGDICSYQDNSITANPDGNKNNYICCVVIKNSNNGLDLKQITGTGSSYTDKPTFVLEQLTIDGGEPITNFASPIECSVGAKLLFTYSFESISSADIQGDVYFKYGAKVLADERVLPSSSTTRTWLFDTSNLSVGKYIISAYARDGAGRYSTRTEVTFQVGGLTLDTTFANNSVVEINKSLTVPVQIASGDETSQITLYYSVDNETPVSQQVYISTQQFEILPASITEGNHILKMHVENTNGKVSAEITRNIIAAAQKTIYTYFTFGNEKVIPNGSLLELPLNIIELNGNLKKYQTVMNVFKYNRVDNVLTKGDAVTIAGSTTKIYTHKYGLNNISINDLNLNVDCRSDEEKENENKEYTAYLLEFSISALTTNESGAEVIDETIPAVSLSIVSKVEKNNLYVSTVDTDLLCWYSSAGKDNNSNDKLNWVDKSSNILASSHIASFKNFNWNTNGWLSDSLGNTALVLNSGAYVELNLEPFVNDIPSGSSMTISVDFSTKDILDADARVVSCTKDYTGDEEITYYLRTVEGDFVKDDQRVGSQTLDVSFNNYDVNYVADNKAAMVALILSQYTSATQYELSQKQDELEALSDDNLLAQWKIRKFEAVNNIIRYFMHSGGYCWVNGITYNNADANIPFETTMNFAERAINYNNAKSAQNNNYSVTGPDYRLYTGKITNDVVKERGFYIDTQYAVLSNSSSPTLTSDKFHINFSEDTRTRVDLIITRSDEAPYYTKSMIAYTNGCLSLMKTLTASDNFGFDGTTGIKVYLGAKVTKDEDDHDIPTHTGECKIYSFRIYQRALTPDEIIRNYIAEVPDNLTYEGTNINVKNNLIKVNNINENTFADLPELCLCGYDIGGDTSSNTITKFIMQLKNSTGISDLKAMKEPAYISYNGKVETENQKWRFTDENGGTVSDIPIRLQFQGTSSMVYPVKNYKFKMYKSITSSSSGAIEYGKKFKVNLGNGFEENCFCLKADYMDSSHCDNTGTANFIDNYNKLVTGATPASEINSNIRTTVYGYPVLLYYKIRPTDPDTKKHFLGVYNLNLDKSCEKSFGFDTKVTSLPDDNDEINTDGYIYEFGNHKFLNDSQDILTKSAETTTVKGTSVYNILTSSNKIVGYMENPKLTLRDVNFDQINAVQCFEFKANSGSAGAGGFGNYSLTSVFTDLESRYPDVGDIEDTNYSKYLSAYISSHSGSSDGALTLKEFMAPYYFHIQRMIKWVYNATENDFINNAEKHFNMNYLLDYYLTILLIGGVDSLGKNLMMATWGCENHFYLSSESEYLSQGSRINTPDKIIQYTQTNGNIIYITKVKSKNPVSSNGKFYYYDYAKDSDNMMLYYNENAYSRYTNKFKNGHTFELSDITKEPGECIWYPLFYDIDTIGGLDNAGQLLYDVDIEPGDRLDDGASIFNTEDSNLWKKVRMYFGKQDEKGSSVLSERWALLQSRNCFTYDTLVGNYYYDKQIKKIPERKYNEDCLIKYVYEGPFKPGETMSDGSTIAPKGSNAYLYCVHGSRYEQIKQWFSQRIYYIESLFGLIGGNESQIRFNHANYDSNYNDEIDYGTTETPNYAALARDYPLLYSYHDGALFSNIGYEIKPIKFEFKTYQPAYVGVRWFNNGKIHFARVKRNGTTELLGNVKGSEDFEVKIYGGSNIKEIGDMSNFNVKSVLFENLTKLNKLILGSNDRSASSIVTLELRNNTYLAELGLRNCQSLLTVDASGCSNLKNIDMLDSAITSITLPSTGGALEYIRYSRNVTNIELHNFSNLSTIETPNVINLTKIEIVDCPKILGSLTNKTGSAWSLLQRTYNSNSLNAITLKSYGSAEPVVTQDSAEYFFLNKFYNKATMKNTIRGEINYRGTIIPEHYSSFENNFPYLKISYNFITNASEMFANYKNLNCISKMTVITGQDIHGKNIYLDVYYWTDLTDDLKARWQTPEVISQYGSSTVYSKDTKYYSKNGKFYRMLCLYDDNDLDILRAEIKSHLSNFHKFENVNGMFKNLSILDYLDPDTFNGIDLSTASTDEMFYGCKNLEYFEIPGDNVKNLPSYEYTNSNGTVVTNIQDWDGTGTPTQRKDADNNLLYLDPFGTDEATTTSSTSTHKKGIRKLGKDMFYNCRKAKIYVHKYPNNEKIILDNSAFRYSIYSNDNKTESFERPVVLFDFAPEQILSTTSASTTTIGEVVYNNEPVGNGQYFSLNSNKQRVLNSLNNVITFSNTDGSWLREVYFNVQSVVRNHNIPGTSTNIDYGTLPNNKIILFKAVSEADRTFNISSNNEYLNGLNIYSITSGAFEKMPELSEIEIPLQKIECFDSNYPLYDEEKSVAGIFTRSAYTFNSLVEVTPNKLTSLYIVDTEDIPDNAFNGFTNINTSMTIGLSNDVKTIGNYAFNAMYNLKRVVYGDKLITPTLLNTIITSIGECAFKDCITLESIYIPHQVSNIGSEAFSGCTKLTSVNFYKISSTNATTLIPEKCFYNCSNLVSVSGLTNNITKIDNYAFGNCKNLRIFNNVSGLALVDESNTSNFEFFENLTEIGNCAFLNVYGCSVSASSIIFGGEGEMDVRHDSLLKFGSSITKIGEYAFAITDPYEQIGFTELAWNNNNENAYSNLVIGNSAFSGIRFCWRKSSNDSDAPVDRCVFLPILNSIGSSVFKLQGNEQFTYALTKNSSSIGSSWIVNSKKVIFKYYGIFNDNTGNNNTGFLFLLSSDTSGLDAETPYNGKAYIQNYSGSVYVTIPGSISYDGKIFKIIEILSGAFDAKGSISSLLFIDSELEKIETNVLKFQALGNIQTTINGVDYQNVIPSSLIIETGNNLKNTQWFNTLKQSIENQGFIKLGKNVIGYIKPANFSGELDLTDSDVSECTTIFDNAFENDAAITSVIFNNNITKIYTSAFAGTSLTSVNLPSNIVSIAPNAFLGCRFAKLFFPKSLTFVGAGAFSEGSNKQSSIGALKSLDIEDGGEFISGSLFEVQQELITGAGNIAVYPEKANITFTTIHVPTPMASLLKSGSSQLKYLSQMTNISLGTLAINDDTSDSYYGTTMCRNIPLYLQNVISYTSASGTTFNQNIAYYTLTNETYTLVPFESRSSENLVNYYTQSVSTVITFENTGTQATDSNGNLLFCPKWYRNMVQGTSLSNSYQQTTIEYETCPVGDFVGDINLSCIRTYDGGQIASGLDGEGITTKELSNLDILKIIAGYTSDSSANESIITLRRAEYNKFNTFAVLLAQTRKRVYTADPIEV